jgi:endo-1,4-beta-D-glucanase Y
MVNQGTPARTGQFYVYADPSQTNQTPPPLGPIAVAAAPADDSPVAPATCNDFALHSTASNYTQYVGVGGFFVSTKATYDLTGYDGVAFKVKTGSSTQPVYFELLTTDSEPALVPATGAGWPGGTAAAANVDQYNHRGRLISNITTSWQTEHVPFSLLIPHWQPSPGSTGCPSPSFCQAPAYNPAHAVGLTLSVYVPDFATTGSYDLWVDDITLYKDPAGTYLTPPNPRTGVSAASFKDGALGSCTKPTKAAGKYLQFAYENWYNRFVTTSGSGLRVQRPENNNDSVSEGTAYGMLIAVYMNDQALFSGLWTYWQQPGNETAGNLETWNNTGGQGSATDADQDAAFALIEAGKRWANASYTSAGTTMVQNIWSHEIDPVSHLPRGGSNYTGTTGGGDLNNTNPSYFAPAYYPTFQAVDSGHAWTGSNSVSTAVYTALNTLANGTTGLVPAWCSNNCTAVGSNGAATDGIYQYDAHRVPWRVGLDYCWNGTAGAKTFLTKISAFFAGMAGSSGANGGGLGRLVDLYNLGGTTASTAPNSMSLIGSAAVGAMSGSNASFVNSAWQILLDGENRATLDVAKAGSQSGYSYYNATVGLLTLLSLSGNLYAM